LIIEAGKVKLRLLKIKFGKIALPPQFKGNHKKELAIAAEEELASLSYSVATVLSVSA